ncbi:alpha/beta hydrolase [uncultured Psychroserpens sp.]|uniref:alpha/beta fold hydrolase n=1 Tax=uncultured Psychroserpens sp. TaxID=255436 RepID=UPI0026374760|nr:alpha/beta hydrolase [uncultured Psychroserpens sp.]
MKQLIIKLIGCIINCIGVLSSRTAGKLAIKLFSTPRKIKFKELEKDFLETAFMEDITSKELTIMTYRWLGAKKTILLAHGWESNSYRWRALIEQLISQNYNVIAIDAPAHGNSSGKLFNAILYAESINHVVEKFNVNIIIGHSVGGMAAVFTQHKYQPSSVEKLVLLGAPSNFVGVLERYVNMMGYKKHIVNSINKIIVERFDKKPDYFNAAKFSETFKIDGLIIHDKYDKIIPYTDAEDFDKYYKNSRLIITKGFGHGLRSEVVNNYVIDFIKV